MITIFFVIQLELVWREKKQILHVEIWKLEYPSTLCSALLIHSHNVIKKKKFQHPPSSYANVEDDFLMQAIKKTMLI